MSEKDKLKKFADKKRKELFAEIEKSKPFLSMYYRHPEASRGIIDMREMEKRGVI